MIRRRIGSLFSGVGGLDLAVESFFDADTVWHCEFDPEPSKVLAARWPDVPNLGDITQVDWATVAPVDILCGGFPCQDLSLAGRRKGLRPGTRSGLWADFRNAIEALRPSIVIIENVRGLLSGCAESDSDVEPCPGCVGDGEHRPLVRALGRVLGDLAALGFDAEWGSLQASDVGAPHGRFRVFVVAYAQGVGFERGWPARERRAGLADSSGGAHLTLLPTRVTEPETGNGHARNLGKEVRLLPTPVTTDANGARNSTANRNTTGSHSGMTITDALLPTPSAADATGGHARRGGERSHELLLPGIAAESITSWGVYEPAIRRWEALTRPAPKPTSPDGKNGRDRLNPELPEWMMGYPAGWITNVIGRAAAIKAAGNAVCPQQAYAAVEQLWGRVESSAVAA